MSNNEIGLCGIEFVEFVSPDPQSLEKLFYEFGFSKTMKHKSRSIELFEQNDIRFLLNKDPHGFAEQFGKLHGPSICSMGWRFENPRNAFENVKKRIKKTPPACGDYAFPDKPVPCVFGIGDSVIYFVENKQGGRARFYHDVGFVEHPQAVHVEQKGFTQIDHLTNNVENGTMETWKTFYREVFGFTEVRYFDIKGVKTGLQSYAMRSPCGTFCIPINEAKEEKSQINEYLREYKGPGIQHIAFLTEDILSSLGKLSASSIEMLDIDEEYYKTVFERVPNVTESHQEIQKRNVLVDGDDSGYLLQIFTKNIIGPIFIEIIQRKNHLAFGEGNFSALFRSIEREQMKQGTL